jgi:hypothetical protein
MMTWTSSCKSAAQRCGAARGRRFAGIAALLLLVPVAALALTPQSSNAGQDSPGTQVTAAAPRPADTDSGMPNVTIQASRERELRLKVDKFVMAVVAPPVWHRSLMRWNSPVCPLVVGLAAAQGEYILSRISQAAHDAGAQLGGRKCQPNLYVAVTATPDKVLKDWVKRDPKIDTRDGPEPLRRFLNSTQPVRVWYDSAGACAGSTPGPQSEAGAQLNSVSSSGVAVPGGNRGGSPAGSLGPVSCDDTLDTHLTFGDVQSITSVLIVADANKLEHVSLGQLADYVSLVGLMDIRPDMDDSGTPTILGLFRDPKPVDTLTRWDRALLYSLYHTPQSTSLQMNDMEISMVKRVAP